MALKYILWQYKNYTGSADMLHGSRECALSSVRLFRCEQVIHFTEFRGGDTLLYIIVRHLQFAVRIGRQVAPGSDLQRAHWSPGGAFEPLADNI